LGWVALVYGTVVLRIFVIGKVAIKIVVLGFVWFKLSWDSSTSTFFLTYCKLLIHIVTSHAVHWRKRRGSGTLLRRRGPSLEGGGERGEGRGVRRVGAGKGGEGGREKIFFRTIFGEEVENLWMNVGRYSETHLLDWFKHLLRV
jgi:hypothetical protein